MDVDLSRPVSILLLQEENKRLKTENFALRKEIEALHKLVNNASIFGITQDHVNALSEIGKILQSCVRPGSGECDSARATFISDGIQTSPIPVCNGTREASRSSLVQPTPQVSVGSGAVDLESNTRPYAQGTQGVSVDSDVEEVNRKPAQQQASPKIVGSGIKKNQW
ncbi:uncharacterized protein [Ptychodera flava]|uniref:uncharacterized protein n=1 Tax=Ptychodera flava TaxID=63121 RepID=UPI00396A9726